MGSPPRTRVAETGTINNPTMYEDFYGLKALPFNITPDPRYLFFSRCHREAFEHIIYGITQRKGFIQITGEVGAGKSTICRAVLEELDEGYSTALILNPVMTGIQLLRTVLRELDLDDRGNDRVRLTDRLNTFLLERANAEQDVVLLIDEAQDMAVGLLEQVRLLSNLETDDRKLLQIVLVGQPELRTMLSGDSLRQLSQRITVRYHLDPIRKDEVEAYILHRLQVAGSNGRPSFTTAATVAVAAAAITAIAFAAINAPAFADEPIRPIVCFIRAPMPRIFPLNWSLSLSVNDACPAGIPFAITLCCP